ncbi:MAG: hypothetical protein ABIH63_04885 [archaeon]
MKDEKNTQIKSYELPQFKRESILDKLPSYLVDNYGNVIRLKKSLNEKVNQLYFNKLN